MAIKIGPFNISSDDAQKIAAFLAGMKKDQIGAWLVKVGKAMQSGQSAGKILAKAGLKIAGSVAGVAAATAIAYGTVNQAISNGEKVIKDEDKSILEKIPRFIWETSIPKATWDQLVSFGKWLTKKPNKNSERAIAGKLNQISVRNISMSPDYAQYDSERRDEKLAWDSQYDTRGIKAMPAADKARLKAEVDKMKEENKKYPTGRTLYHNDPKWYWKGNADKLIAGTLTWSDVKTNHKTLPLVALTTISLDLVLPLVDGKLPIKVVNNYDALFAALRGPNTGAYNYAAEDVFWYTIYLYSFITRIRYIQKIIKAAHTHKIEQDNLAKILTEKISGFSSFYSEIVKDGPNLISRLNALSEDINTWPLIGTSWLSRWNYLADKCIKDYNGPKAALGVYCVHSIISLDSTGVPVQANAISSTVAGTIANLEAEYATFKSLSGTLNVKNCMLKIAGDMCKLLGTSENVFSNVPYMDQVRPGCLTFDYDEEAKFQLQNAKLAGRDASFSNWVIPSFDGATSGVYTYTNILGTSSMTLSGTDPYNKSTPWIVTNDSNTAVRTDANNIEMTQFVYNAEIVQNDGSGKYTQTMTDVSIAIFAYFGVHYYTPNGTGAAVTTGYISTFCNPGGSASYQDTLSWQMFVAIRQIDFLPSPVIVTGSTTKTIQGRYIDVDNYAEITSDQIKNYLKVATYSLSYTYSMEDVDLKAKIKR